jgi:hypothetical protein
MPETSTIRIGSRFCGPPDCGNGGYTAGRLASALEGPVEVTLRAPAPLDTELTLEARADGAQLTTAEGRLIAEAKPISFELTLPRAVSFASAEQASRRFVGFADHPYPGCFVCGTTRAPAQGAGLTLFPGALSDGPQPAVVAAPFVPAHELCDAGGLLSHEFVWAALDCPSWFGHAAFVRDPPPILLGKLALTSLRRPRALEPCVVQGWGIGQEGRRIQCGSALYAADGECLAYSRSTWVALKLS